MPYPQTAAWWRDVPRPRAYLSAGLILKDFASEGWTARMFADAHLPHNALAGSSLAARARAVSARTAGRVSLAATVMHYGKACYLCGVLTSFMDRRLVERQDRSRYWKYGDSYPTVEHVVPLSRGGDHTLENTRTACLACNRRKGNRLVESVEP